MAPIVLKAVSWDQTLSTITVHVPFHGKRPPSSLEQDITTLDDYIKISYPPYQFELFLSQEINSNDSSCTILKDKIILQLQKKFPEMWSDLETPLTGKEKVEKRKEISDRLQEESKKCLEERKQQKSEMKQASVRDQINLDTQKKTLAEEKRASERGKVTQYLDSLNQRHEEENISERCETRVKEETLCERAGAADELNRRKKREEFPVPLVRENGSITVNFSERVFPTPCRESLLADEKEYLTKQLAARRATGFASEDLRPEECDPVWLKNKGDSFYTSKNYLAAISAYSHAIKIGARMPELYSNRSACHFQLKNLHKALEDISTALELFTPPVKANKDARAKCFARRAVILCQLGLAEKSLPEFEEALKLHPDDSELRRAYEKAKTKTEDSTDSDSS